MVTTVQAAVMSDTMVVSALVNAYRQPGPAAAFRQLIAGRRVVIPFVNVSELRYGTNQAGWSELRRLRPERLVVVQPDDQVIDIYADLRTAAEKAGHGLGQKIHEADRWIAATAIRLHVEFVTDDSIFVDAPGLALAPLI